MRQRAGMIAAVVCAAVGLGLASCSASQPSLPATPPVVVSPATQPGTIRPNLTELPTEGLTSDEAPSLPWSLISVDELHDRIYLSSDKRGCVTPQKVQVVETSASITLFVRGSALTERSEPCTSEERALIGYVTTTTAIGDRSIRHGPTS